MVLKYKPDTISYQQLKESAVIPKFQRGLVWSPNAKKEFIKTLADGYPFGSLLLYKYKNEDKNSIIDGLQRFTTIRDFEDNPGDYWSLEDKAQEKEAWKRIFSTFSNEEGVLIDEKNLDESFEKLVNFEIDATDVIGTIGDENYKLLNPSRSTEVSVFAKQLQEKVRNFIDLNELQIPVIEFKGDVDELATVFENLNKSGTSLSKFQVFQAAWNSDMVSIPNTSNGTDVLDFILRRYRNLEDSTNLKFDDNWQPENILETREITLSEFAYGIGALMYSVLDGLIGSKEISESESTVNNLGFSMLGIITNVPNTKLALLNGRVPFKIISENISDIIEGVKVVSKQVKDQLAPLLKKPVMQGERSEYELGLTTEFKILSYFAAVWVTSYGVNESDDIYKLDSANDRDRLSKVLKNIPIYYLNDFFSNLWRSSGDNRLSSYYLIDSDTAFPERNYWNSVAKDRFLENFTNWNREYSSTGTINIQREIKALITVWSNLSSDIKFEPAKNYDFEHVFPRAFVQKIYKKANFPAGALGNVMYLDTTINKKKQKKNLFEVDNINNIQEIRTAVFYPKKGDFVNFSEELALQGSQLDETAEVIYNRGQQIGKNIADSLGLN